MSDTRALVLAKPADGRPAAPSNPVSMGGGRIPSGGQGANNNIKMKSIFDNSSQNNVKFMGQNSVPPRAEAPQRPVVFAKLGQADSDVPTAPEVAPISISTPRADINAVLIREGGPEGLTRKEASDISAALLDAIQQSSSALGDGQVCVGVDSSTLDKAREIQVGLNKFSSTGNSSERLDLDPDEVEIVEKVIECGQVYQAAQAASKGKTIAFVAGGLIIGVVVLLAMS